MAAAAAVCVAAGVSTTAGVCAAAAAAAAAASAAAASNTSGPCILHFYCSRECACVCINIYLLVLRLLMDFKENFYRFLFCWRLSSCMRFSLYF